MDRFEQFKSSFPEFSNLSNGEIVNLVSQYTGADPQRVYSEFGGEQNRSAMGDLGTALKIGVQRLPETITGLGDVLVAPGTGRASISDAADSLGRATGFRPGQWANDSQLDYSPAQQRFLQQGAQTEGFADTAAHYLTNPVQSVVQGVESVPGMALGGVYARGLRGLGALSNAARFGAGEGGVMAGQAMNQMVEDGVDPRRAAGYAAGVGALGGALGYGGGRLAERLGVVNPDELLGFGGRTALAQGATAPGLGRRVVGGMLSEGAFEEAPQSAMEAVMGNLAAERPWDQDVGKQAAAGLVLGGLLGGVVGVVPPARNPADPIDILNRDTTPQSEAAPQVGQSELNFGVTGEEAIGTRGLRNPFDVAGYVSGFQQGQETTVDVPQSDLFGGANERPPVDIPRPPKIDIPVPQPLQSDPVRSAVAQASPATLRRDGSLKRNVEEAIAQYNGFPFSEIERELESLESSRKAEAVWRVAALEAIARQRAPQGAPNVAQVDAASGQGAGAVPAGSAGNTPSGPVNLGGVRQPAGAPAPSSAAGIPVGEPVVQQPASVEDVINAVSPTQQVAAQAQEAGGQEGAQVEQAREPVVTAEELRIAQKRDADPTAPGAVKIIGSDGVERWVTPSKTKTAAKGKREAGERVPFEQLRGTEQQMVRDFMGYDEFGEVSEEAAPMSFRQMAPIYGMAHETVAKRLADLGYTDEFRKKESAAEETFLTESTIGREDSSPELSDEAIDIADVVGGNLRVQKGVGAKGNTGAGLGYQKLLAAGTRFDARTDKRLVWSEAAIAEAVASNALSDEQLVAAEKELAARAKREADERAAKQSKRGERAAPAPRTQEQAAQEGRAVSRAQNQAEREARVRAEREARVRAEREAAEQEVQRRVAAEAALQRKVDQFLATPESQKAASYWNRFADEGVLPFADLPQELQVEWVQRYIETLEELPADKRVPDAMEALQSATQQEYMNDEAYQSAVASVGEAVAGGDQAVPRDQGVEEGNRPDEVAREEVTPANPLEARIAALRELDLGEKQSARLDKLVRRQQNREIDAERLGEELQAMEENAFPEDRGGKGMRYSRTTDTQGTTVEAVRSAINDIATPAGNRKITVVQSADELIERGILNSNEARGTQGWVDAKGNAYFIAGNIPKGSELAVVLHEIGAHLGIEKMLTDKQYEALVKKIFDWAQSDANTQEAHIARAALARVDAAKLENDADVAPEVIAYFVEEAVKAGVNPTALQYKTELGRWFRTLWAAFKVALRRLNLINADRLTAQNVVDLAYGAARVQLAGQYHGTASNFRRFDHRFMGSGEGAQAFGWGTYLAQRFGIANEYFEADVRRKDRGGVPYPTYDGERLPDPFAVDTANPSEIAKNALSLVHGGVMPNPRVYIDSLFVDDKVAAEALAVYQTLDPKKLGWVKDGAPEGNIHITDVNATEDELLDWDKPLSEQTVVNELLLNNLDVDLMDKANLRESDTGKAAYRRLERALGSDKAASEYLDSLGIKGIKFLDAMSRQRVPPPRSAKGWSAELLTNEIVQLKAEIQRLENEAVELGGITQATATLRSGDVVDVASRTKWVQREIAKLTALVADKYADLRTIPEAPKPTRNLVIFNDANIFRVGSMRGGPVDKGGRMMFSKTADPQLTELAQETGQRALKAIQAGIRKGWTGLAFSSHLANAAHRAGLTSARALELVQRKKATRAYEIQIEVEKVLSKFADLKVQINGRPASEVVQRFIYDSTFDKKWGFAPDWKDDAIVDPEMESRFKALPADAQAVIKDVFRHGDAIFKEKQALLRKTITGEYEALIKAETDDGKRRKLERQRDKELREAGRLISEMNGPYAPLRRYGNYVVVAKSQKYRDAEAAGPVDAELKRDEKHYVVEFAETLYEAERLQGVLEGKFGTGMVWAGEKETATEQFGELPFMAVQRLRKMVDTDLDGDLNTKSKRTLNKLLVDLYISTLHEANARHSEQKRQFVNRADRDTAAKDMMRAFATQGRADSHLVSALQFNSEIVDEMQKLRNEAKNGQGDSKLKTRLRNEILQRHMMDLDFRETPVQDKLMSLNSFWMLLTSPGYYVQNATQVMMMTQPVLAGKFGQNRSMRQLMRGYQDAMRVLKGSSWNEAADLSRFNGTADEKAMLVELQARGTLDFGISAELGYWESRGEISKVFNQVMRKVGMGTRKLEVLNRMSSALAAYRMMYDQTTGTQAKRHADALDYADSIIKDTHGDYSTTNAPRYLRMMPKVMTQFRKFQLIQLSLFAKVIHGSVKGANPQEKRAMRAALGYLFMNHALLAGAVGVPASALLGAIYAIAGDDDDPNDWEVDVRRAVGDKEMADLILHGLPSLININMSNKIGAGTMLDPLPFVEYEATRGGYEKAVTAAMGPLIGGLGAQAVDAFGRILKGDVAQGTAQLLPRGFRDAARGFMAAQDGIQLRNGQTALAPEELSFYDSLMMGLGLPTLKTTGRTETQFKSQQYETFFRERVTKLKRQYSEAYEENDREAMLEARQAWAAMQASRKNLGFKAQPLSDLLKAPREKAKAEAKLENGIRTSEQARGFVKSLQ